MKILDRYICKKFLSIFIFVNIIAISLIFIFDYMEKGNYFFSNHLSRYEIWDYYKAYIPYMLNFLVPIITFIATVFTTSRLSNRSEILAILGSGVNYKRFLLSFLKPAIIITAANFYINGWIIAKANKKWIAFEEEYLFNSYNSEKDQIGKNLHLKINGERYMTIGRYKSIKKAGSNILLDTFKDNKLQTRLFASEMYMDKDLKKWVLRDWTKRELQDRGEIITSGDFISPDIELNPNDILINPRLQEMLNLSELISRIKLMKEQGSMNVNLFQVERDIKYMSPFAIIILTIMGVIFCSYKSRMGNSIRIAIGFILAFTYVALFLFVKGIATFSQTNTTLVIWMPNIIFSSVTFFLYKVIPK